MSDYIAITQPVNAVAEISLNRPDKHNAFNAEIISALIEALETLRQDKSVRVLLLSAQGKNFSAGADLHWMSSMRQASEAVNKADAKRLAKLLQLLHDFPKPTIAKVQGAAFGGAIGLISCCDMAIATNDSRFCLSEVKLGLSPATVGPYVVAAIGARQARRYFLSAEVFNAETALDLGLIHVLASDQTEQEQQINQWFKALLANGPEALAASKELISQIENSALDSSDSQADLQDYSASLIARLRVSDEGQEGLNAFFDKRHASFNLAAKGDADV